MSVKVLSAAIVAAILSASAVRADLRGPAELPPASFKGQQYVDSRGCVFLRAGYGGRETWVPRVSRDRKQLCGFPASGGARAEATENQPVTKAAPPAAAAAPASSTTHAGSKSFAAKPSGAASAAPRVSLSQSAAPAGAPLAAEGASPRKASSFSAPQSARKSAIPRAESEIRIPTPPPGYKLAWTDDRLNPNRGRGTVAGVSAQDQVWTRHTPAKLRAPENRARPPLTVVVSIDPDSAAPRRSPAASAPAPAGQRAIKAAGQHMVQVGSFKREANAGATAARLRSAGLPVARGKSQGYDVVYAGPFASREAAQAAQAQLRGLGFGDTRLLR